MPNGTQSSETDLPKGTGVFIPKVLNRRPAKSVSFSVAKSSGATNYKTHPRPTKSRSFAWANLHTTPISNNLLLSDSSGAGPGEVWVAEQQPAIRPLGHLHRTASSPLPVDIWPCGQEAATTTATWCDSLGSSGCWPAAGACTTTDSSMEFDACWAPDEELCRTNSNNVMTAHLQPAAGSPGRDDGRDRLHLLGGFYGSRTSPAAPAPMACSSNSSSTSVSAMLPSINAPQPLAAVHALSAPLPGLATNNTDATMDLIDLELERLLALRQQLTVGMSRLHSGSSNRSSATNVTPDLAGVALMADSDQFELVTLPLQGQQEQQQLLTQQAREKLQQLQLMQQLQSKLQEELLQLLPMCS